MGIVGGNVGSTINGGHVKSVGSIARNLNEKRKPYPRGKDRSVRTESTVAATTTTSIHDVCEEKPNVFEQKINASRHKAQVDFYVHTKSKLDESVSSLEDSVKDIFTMPFD